MSLALYRYTLVQLHENQSQSLFKIWNLKCVPDSVLFHLKCCFEELNLLICLACSLEKRPFILHLLKDLTRVSGAISNKRSTKREFLNHPNPTSKRQHEAKLFRKMSLRQT